MVGKGWGCGVRRTRLAITSCLHTVEVVWGCAVEVMWGCAVEVMWGVCSGGDVGVCSGGDVGVCSGGDVGVCSGGDVGVCSGGDVGVYSGGGVHEVGLPSLSRMLTVAVSCPTVTSLSGMVVPTMMTRTSSVSSACSSSIVGSWKTTCPCSGSKVTLLMAGV